MMKNVGFDIYVVITIISIKQIYLMNHVSVEALTTGRMIKRRLTVQQQSYRHCDSNNNVDIKAYSFHHILILTVL
jgi:hypothetical protein